MKKLLLLGSCLISMGLLAQSWTPVADIPAGVHHPVTWGIGDYGYSATGTNASNQPTNDFYRYDPQNDSWNTLQDFPGTARSFAIGTVYKGLGYLGFGATTTSVLRDLWSFDPVSEQWTQLASCPCQGRRHPSFVAVNDAIYVGLGDGQLGDYRDWWKYDISTDAWVKLPDLPGPGRHHPFQFVVNDQIYAGLGHSGPLVYNDWYRLDPSTDTWMKMKNFPGEARVAGTQFDHAHRGYVLSGDGDNHSFMATGEFWEYDEQDDSWTELSPHPGRSRWAPGSFVVNDELYFFGGLDRGNQQLTRKAYKYGMPSTVGLKEEEVLALNIYPNPARDIIRVDSEEEFEGLEMINSTGQLVLKAGEVQQLDVSQLPAGMYHVRIIKEGRVAASERLMKR